MNDITPGYLTQIARQSHEIACSKGWWGDGASPDTIKTDERNIGEILMLATSELSEALEHYRDAKDQAALTKIWWDQSGGTGSMGVMSEIPIPGGKPDGFAIELADVAIRLVENIQALLGPKAVFLFNYVYHSRLATTAARDLVPELMDDVDPKSTNIPERLKQIDIYIAEAYKRIGPDDGPATIYADHLNKEIDGCTVQMAQAVIETFVLADDLDIDLRKAISVKAEYNASRPYRHGGRKA